MCRVLLTIVRKRIGHGGFPSRPIPYLWQKKNRWDPIFNVFHPGPWQNSLEFRWGLMSLFMHEWRTSGTVRFCALELSNILNFGECGRWGRFWYSICRFVGECGRWGRLWYSICRFVESRPAGFSELCPHFQIVLSLTSSFLLPSFLLESVESISWTIE